MTSIVALLKAAVPELLGGIATEFLTSTTKKLVQKFQNQKSRQQKDFDAALPRVLAGLEVQYGHHARMVQLLDAIGQNAKRSETREFFSAAMQAYLFQNIWRRHDLPELLAKFTQARNVSLPEYGWPQADVDLAEFFRRLETELVQSSREWRELFDHQRLEEIALAAFNIAGDTKQMVQLLQKLVRQSAAPPPDISALRRIYLEHLKHRFSALDFRGTSQVKNIVKMICSNATRTIVSSLPRGLPAMIAPRLARRFGNARSCRLTTTKCAALHGNGASRLK